MLCCAVAMLSLCSYGSSSSSRTRRRSSVGYVGSYYSYVACWIELEQRHVALFRPRRFCACLPLSYGKEQGSCGAFVGACCGWWLWARPFRCEEKPQQALPIIDRQARQPQLHQPHQPQPCHPRWPSSSLFAAATRRTAAVPIGTRRPPPPPPLPLSRELCPRSKERPSRPR